MSDVQSTNSSGGSNARRILIIGGGSAGISVAARLCRAGQRDVTVIEPSATHYYQPAWTLVGGGATAPQSTARPTNRVIPRGVRWLQDRVVSIDAVERTVTTESSGEIRYDYLVAAPGIQLDWDRISGLRNALETPHASSNYDYELAPKTWQCLQRLEGGTALFSCPPMPIKCAGAPQKIMYMACDYFRRREMLDKTQVIFGTATPSMFAVPEYSAVLDGVVERYGIDVRFTHNLVRVDADRRDAFFEVTTGDEKREVSVHYDFLHAVPPQSAPDFIKRSPLADAQGWIDVDKHTLRHTKFPDVFALGDATNTPNTKTGAAVRSQAPVAVENLLATISGREMAARYDGYGACPLVTSYRSVLLAEFDYSKKPTPMIPLINTMKERYDMWLLKKYGLPWFYWNLMLNHSLRRRRIRSQSWTALWVRSQTRCSS
jgi:sulfide:quinone oxidoreductase